MILLEASTDIQNTERDLREIQVLQSKDVACFTSLRSGMVHEIQYWTTMCELELLPLRVNLTDGSQRSRERARELDRVRKQVMDLLSRYNQFVSSSLPLRFCTETLRSRRMQELYWKDWFSNSG